MFFNQVMIKVFPANQKKGYYHQLFESKFGEFSSLLQTKNFSNHWKDTLLFTTVLQGKKKNQTRKTTPQSSTFRTSPSITSSELPEVKLKSQVLTFSGMQSLISCLLCEYIKLGHVGNLGRSDLKPHSWWAVSLTTTKIFYKTSIKSLKNLIFLAFQQKSSLGH